MILINGLWSERSSSAWIRLRAPSAAVEMVGIYKNICVIYQEQQSEEREQEMFYVWRRIYQKTQTRPKKTEWNTFMERSVTSATTERRRRKRRQRSLHWPSMKTNPSVAQKRNWQQAPGICANITAQKTGSLSSSPDNIASTSGVNRRGSFAHKQRRVKVRTWKRVKTFLFCKRSKKRCSHMAKPEPASFTDADCDKTQTNMTSSSLLHYESLKTDSYLQGQLERTLFIVINYSHRRTKDSEMNISN